MDKSFKLVFILFFLFSSPSYALVKSIGFTNTVKTTAIGVSSTVKFSSNGSFYTKAVDIGLASVGAVFRKRSFSPWGAALTVAIVAAGFLYDGDTETITNEVIGSSDLGTCSRLGNSLSTGSECLAAMNAISWVTGGCTVQPQQQTSTSWTFAFFGTCGGTSDSFILSEVPLFAPFSSSNPATDTELATQVIPFFEDYQFPDILTDPATGLPDDVITEIATAANDLDTEIALLEDADPLNDPLVLTPEQTGNEAMLEELIKSNRDLKEAVEGQAQTDQCVDYPNSVGCVDLGNEILDETLTTVEIPFSYTPVTLFSNSNCPAPQVMALSSGNITLSNSSVCTFATGINPIVLVVSTLIGLYILSGGVRNA